MNRWRDPREGSTYPDAKSRLHRRSTTRQHLCENLGIHNRCTFCRCQAFIDLSIWHLWFSNWTITWALPLFLLRCWKGQGAIPLCPEEPTRSSSMSRNLPRTNPQGYEPILQSHSFGHYISDKLVFTFFQEQGIQE